MRSITPSPIVGDKGKSVKPFVVAMPQGVASQTDLADASHPVNKLHLSGKVFASTVIVVDDSGKLVGLGLASGSEPTDEWKILGGSTPPPIDPPVITMDLPATFSVTVPSALHLQIDATGADTYDWYVDGTLWAADHTSSVTIDPTEAGMVGNYSIYVNAINAGGTTKSTVCEVTIAEP